MNDIGRKKKQVLAILATVAVGIIMLAGAVVWILSLEGIVIGLWAGVMSVVFTFLGVLYGLLQWLAQLEEQKAIKGRGDLVGASGSLIQGQECSQAECLTSCVARLPLVEVPPSSMPLSSSVVDNSLTVTLRGVAVTNEVEENSSLQQRNVSIHIYIYHENRF